MCAAFVPGDDDPIFSIPPPFFARPDVDMSSEGHSHIQDVHSLWDRPVRELPPERPREDSAAKTRTRGKAAKIRPRVDSADSAALVVVDSEPWNKRHRADNEEKIHEFVEDLKQSMKSSASSESSGISDIFKKLLRKWGIPFVLNVLGPYLGIPSWLMKPLSAVVGISLSDNLTSIVNTVLGQSAPQIMDSFLTNGVYLLDSLLSSSGAIIQAVGQGALRGEQEIRAILDWYQNHKALVLQTKTDSIETFRKMQELTADSAEKTPQHRSKAYNQLEKSGEVSIARAKWKKFIDTIDEIWQRWYANYGKKDQTKIFGELWRWPKYLPHGPIPDLYERFYPIVENLMTEFFMISEDYPEQGFFSRLFSKTPMKHLRIAFQKAILEPLAVMSNDALATGRALMVNPTGRMTERELYKGATANKDIFGFGRKRKQTKKQTKKHTKHGDIDMKAYMAYVRSFKKK